MLSQPDHKVSTETKNRAKAWIQRAATDPTVRKAFREASAESAQAFLEADEAQQHDFLRIVPKPAFTQVVQVLKAQGLWEDEEQIQERARKQAEYEKAQEDLRVYLKKFDAWLRTRIDQLIRMAKPEITCTYMCMGCKGRFKRKSRQKILEVEKLFEERYPNEAFHFIHESCKWKYFAKSDLFELVPEGQYADQVFVVPDTFFSKRVMQAPKNRMTDDEVIGELRREFERVTYGRDTK